VQHKQFGKKAKQQGQIRDNWIGLRIGLEVVQNAVGRSTSRCTRPAAFKDIVVFADAPLGAAPSPRRWLAGFTLSRSYLPRWSAAQVGADVFAEHGHGLGGNLLLFAAYVAREPGGHWCHRAFCW
jgi:hypothetical protein